MSASSTPTEAPSAAKASARFTAVVDLPTPPFAEATAMTFLSSRVVAHAVQRGVRHHPGAQAHRDVRGARLLQRLDDLAANRLVLALARVAELEVERDVVAGELHVARRARGYEVLAGIRVDELLEDALNVRVTERHLQSVS